MADSTVTGSLPPPPQGRGRSVVIALAVTVALLAVLLLGIVIARRGGEDASPPVRGGPTTAPPVSPTTQPASSTTTPQTTSTSAPAPATVLAASDQKVVLLDTANGRAVRVLFDLGPSAPTDPAPPAIGSVALSADGQTAFFDLIGQSSPGTLKRVATRGGAAEDLGAGRAPTPSPAGSTLSFLRSTEPGKDAVVLREADGNERVIPLGAAACGTVAWAPDSKRLAVDLCSNGEPTTVAEVDVIAARSTTLNPPEGLRWIAPSYRPDNVLTLAEDRHGDSVVVTVVGGRVTGDILRRNRTTLVCLDWDRNRSLLFCEADGSVWVDPADDDAHVVGTGYHAAAW